MVAGKTTRKKREIEGVAIDTANNSEPMLDDRVSTPPPDEPQKEGKRTKARKAPADSATMAAEARNHPDTGRHRTRPGRQHPQGATPDDHGVNFSIFSERATYVELLLFDEHDDLEPFQVIPLNSAENKTFHFWHVYVKGLKPGAHYAYRVSGPQEVHNYGDRFSYHKVIIDPYARGNTDALWDRGKACGPDDNLATSMRSVVIDMRDYDWEGDQPLNRTMNDTIIYEMHVGGFTKSPTAGVNNPGTYTGLIEKIGYLQELGITAIELLPVHDFDQKEVLRLSPSDGKPLYNYWGSPHEGQHVNEFRDMVKALHCAGIEVILDVVYNHTSEGNHQGPTINFKGMDNSVYYHLVRDDRQYYMDWSGCGNTVKANHPIVEKFIVDSLEFWVREMHVDGFRFDEAVILTRDEKDGTPMLHPPVIWNIELSETLADTKVIAECWDAAGLNEIGFFPGYRWGEWNGLFRDRIRRFVRGDAGGTPCGDHQINLIGGVATVLAGSADIFQGSGQSPVNSVNFIACHDGFTLYDLVAYNGKHNEANGENNRDGIDENLSWNCGAEGETDNPWVMALRKQQIKNFASILMVAQGVPMFLYGDEVLRTQYGNNNAYCQDNELSWFDWNLVEKNQDMFRFWKHIIAFRKEHPILRRARFFTGERNARSLSDIAWHGTQVYNPGWYDPEARALAFTMGGEGDEADLYVMMNMFWDELTFEVLPIQGRRWMRVVDTALPSPQDIVEAGQEDTEIVGNYRLKGRSVVILISKD